MATSSATPPVSAHTIKIKLPALVYDGACSFCKYWISRWRRLTQNKVQYVPYQEVPDGFYGIRHAQFKKSVYLITVYGRPLHAAAAVAALLQLSGYGTWHWLYHRIPLAGKLAEAGYRIVANHRNFFYKLTRLFFRNA
ncbi:thiol-disulfide oxidoreductase DCC family protein [Pontibacter oryzae]|nr:DCC1-like thiol-disulfide oxidoreductase family protein [Pontibacter oryzae]